MHNLIISYKLTSPEANGDKGDLKQRAATGGEPAFLTAMVKVLAAETVIDDKLS